MISCFYSSAFSTISTFLIKKTSFKACSCAFKRIFDTSSTESLNNYYNFSSYQKLLGKNIRSNDLHILSFVDINRNSRPKFIFLPKSFTNALKITFPNKKLFISFINQIVNYIFWLSIAKFDISVKYDLDRLIWLNWWQLTIIKASILPDRHD